MRFYSDYSDLAMDVAVMSPPHTYSLLLIDIKVATAFIVIKPLSEIKRDEGGDNPKSFCILK